MGTGFVSASEMLIPSLPLVLIQTASGLHPVPNRLIARPAHAKSDMKRKKERHYYQDHQKISGDTLHSSHLNPFAPVPVSPLSLHAGEFMANPWSVFDLFVVCASLVELIYVYLVAKLSDANASSVNISVLRLLRVFRSLACVCSPPF